jgi:hypothetical protein
MDGDEIDELVYRYVREALECELLVQTALF